MFGLIRRISHSVLPRADRPWDDDATSNAPKTSSRKRRLSSTEREDGPKKARGDTPVTPFDENPPLFAPESKEVKDMTRGVKDVDLNADEAAKLKEPERETKKADREQGDEADKVAADVPLPEEKDDELEEQEDISSTPEPSAPVLTEEAPVADLADTKVEAAVVADVAPSAAADVLPSADASVTDDAPVPAVSEPSVSSESTSTIPTTTDAEPVVEKPIAVEAKAD